MYKVLKHKWKEVCNEYLLRFCKKHEYHFESDAWVGGDPGTIANVADYFVGMDNIRYDIDHDIPKEVFVSWYDYDLRLAELDCPRRINYPSWCKGAPLPYREDELRAIEEAQKRVRKAKEALEKLLTEEKDAKHS